MTEAHQKILDSFRAERERFVLFAEAVRRFFEIHEPLNLAPFPIVHSLKSRVKSVESLHAKILRKEARDGIELTSDNLYEHITDLAGVRVLHLYRGQFPEIHQAIQRHVESGEWVLAEPPVAYSWDPELEGQFQSLGLTTKIKESQYTSVHYVLRPRHGSPIACEVQVRTLFEEGWGEIDHSLNYPEETTSVGCREQIAVLAKIVSAATRSADAIFRTKRAGQ